MTDARMPPRPVGWWLKEADARLDAAFDQALADRDLDRRGWQVLASLARAPMGAEDLAIALAAFDPASEVRRVVEALAARGWVEESGGRLRLTSTGADAQAAAAPLVDSVRRTVAAALPGEDYATLLRLLAQLVDALPPRA